MNQHRCDLKPSDISLAVMGSGIRAKWKEMGLTAKWIYEMGSATTAQLRGEKNPSFFPEVAYRLCSCYNRQPVFKISLEYTAGFQWIFFNIWWSFLSRLNWISLEIFRPEQRDNLIRLISLKFFPAFHTAHFVWMLI